LGSIWRRPCSNASNIQSTDWRGSRLNSHNSCLRPFYSSPDLAGKEKIVQTENKNILKERIILQWQQVPLSRTSDYHQTGAYYTVSELRGMYTSPLRQKFEHLNECNQPAGSAFNGFSTAAIPTLYVFSTGDRLPFTDGPPVAKALHRASDASSEAEGDLFTPPSEPLSPRSDDGFFVMEDAGGVFGSRSSIDSDVGGFLR
jgi:hypothetical protein